MSMQPITQPTVKHHLISRSNAEENALECMGFRGSRVQIPPSRFKEVQASLAFAPTVLFLFATPWQSFGRVSLCLWVRQRLFLDRKVSVLVACHRTPASYPDASFLHYRH
jgi:hypothetical protein